ncbi:MAG: transglutaminase-like domain-containing protein [Clostridiaceae bacterium]|nr:transglutaminase-like domain-containing protein [Clostridiaceae bacterium]
MKRKAFLRITMLTAAICAAAFLVTSCSAITGSHTADGDADDAAFLADIMETVVPADQIPTLTTVLQPEASGKTVYSNDLVKIDASNAAQGYVMIQYTGSVPKIKVQIQKGEGTKYTYDLNARDTYEVFPLTDGNGTYSIKVYENTTGTKYSTALGQNISVKLANDFLPFLYPNQYVNFANDSNVVAKAAELVTEDMTDLEMVGAVYNYVVQNLKYDKIKAKTVESGYLPDVDTILESGKGICFDYAAVMAAMLRSLNIPTKLVVGYAGSTYHAWISVYVAEEGWLDGVIFFDGSDWERMDPTFASSGKQSEAIMKYIGDGSNYASKFIY